MFSCWINIYPRYLNNCVLIKSHGWLILVVYIFFKVYSSTLAFPTIKQNPILFMYRNFAHGFNSVNTASYSSNLLLNSCQISKQKMPMFKVLTNGVAHHYCYHNTPRGHSVQCYNML